MSPNAAPSHSSMHRPIPPIHVVTWCGKSISSAYLLAAEYIFLNYATACHSCHESLDPLYARIRETALNIMYDILIISVACYSPAWRRAELPITIIAHALMMCSVKWHDKHHFIHISFSNNFNCNFISCIITFNIFFRVSFCCKRVRRGFRSTR